MKKRKILFITGMRSDFFIQEPILKEIEKMSSLEYGLIVTGGHLKKKFGYTFKDIVSKKYKVIAKINNLVESDKITSRINGISRQIPKIINVFEKFKPHIVVAPYDREESIVIALIATYMNIPIAHLGAGDITNINVDGIVRHSVSKLSHIFFTFTNSSYKRLIRLGEEKFRIYNVGHTIIDRYKNINKISKKQLSKFFKLDFNFKPIILLIQHPVSNNYKESSNQINITLSAIDNLNFHTIIVLPNSDLGSYSMRDKITKYKFRNNKIRIFKNIPEIYFVNMMKYISIIIGNSSMGVLEAPLFKIPVINIGLRQLDRENAGNIIFVPHEKLRIEHAVKKCLYDKAYIKKIKSIKNPYGKINASKKIASILVKIKINEKLLNKRITY